MIGLTSGAELWHSAILTVGFSPRGGPAAADPKTPAGPPGLRSAGVSRRASPKAD